MAQETIGAHETISMVALLTWTYQRQRADLMTGRSLAGEETDPGESVRQHWSGDGCAQLEMVGRLGCRVDGGGWQRPALHADAEAVHDLVIALSRTDWPGAMLLRRHGRRGDTPDWGAEQWLEPVYDAHDGIVDDRYDEVVMVADKSGRERVVPVRYCPLHRYPSDEWVALTRAEYGAWFEALVRLTGMANARGLSRWKVQGFGAFREPWNKT